MEALSIFIGLIVLVIGVLIYSSLSWGFVLMKFYGWFVLPVFTSLPEINYWHAVGLMFVIGLFNRHVGEGIKKEYKDESTVMTMSIINPWLTLFFGWLIFTMFIQ